MGHFPNIPNMKQWGIYFILGIYMGTRVCGRSPSSKLDAKGCGRVQKHPEPKNSYPASPSKRMGRQPPQSLNNFLTSKLDTGYLSRIKPMVSFIVIITILILTEIVILSKGLFKFYLGFFFPFGFLRLGFSA